MSRQLQVAHTSDLDARTLAEARALLALVFADDFHDEDWEHALGGMHVMIREDGVLVAHASVVQRRLLYQGRALRCGYVEAVGVRPDRQREGLGSAVMDEVERISRGAYDLGALGASEEGLGLYLRRGWERWTGRLHTMSPTGLVRTEEEDGWVLVLPVSVPLEPAADLACDWREGDVW